ncbi:hypothetical protein AAC387_Pa02g1686 [Persea americana]
MMIAFSNILDFLDIFANFFGLKKNSHRDNRNGPISATVPISYRFSGPAETATETEILNHVRKYRGHHYRAAFSLLGYKPHYKSFITPRRVTGIDSVLDGEGVGLNTEQTEVPISETVTVAIPSGIPAELGEESRGQEPAELIQLGRVRSRDAARSSPALRGRRPLRRSIWGRRGRDLGPFRGADVAPTTSSAAAAEALAPETETVPEAIDGAQSGPPAAAEVGAYPPATVVEESPSNSGREGTAEVVEARRPEKRPRAEPPSAPDPAMSVGGSATPSDFVPWRPDIEGVLGRQLAESDRAVNPEVVASLRRACALPQDMARWAQMDNESLLLSSMRSLVAVCTLILHVLFFFCCISFGDTLFLPQLLQKCQTGMGRLDTAEARAAVWAAEKEELLKSLAARDATLEEEARKNEDLLVELDAARALAEHLKEEAKEAADQNVHLSWELDEVRLASSRKEENMQMLRGTNRRLISERKLAERKLEMALEGKAAELAQALKGQEAKLKEEYLAEHEAVMNEEVSKLTADYKAQLLGIRDKAWTLGWKAALKRVGVPTDSPIFQNSPRFPRSDSELRAISEFAPIPSSSEVPPAPVAPAPPVVPETASVVPSESATGTNCNKGPAAPSLCTALRAVGPLNRGAEPRGWYCYRTLTCIWLCRPHWCRHRAEGDWPSEQRRRAARVVLLPDPNVHLAVPPQRVQAPS